MEVLVSLAALALVDSTSFGTLVIPLALIIRSRGVQLPGLLAYFGTVVGLYFLIGIALLLGAEALTDWVSDLLELRVVKWAQLVLGLGLLAFGVFKRKPKNKPPRTAKVPARLAPRAMVTLALGAVVLEVATMLPYIAAIAILSSMGVGVGIKFGILLAYCLVMILPAVVLIGIAKLFGERIWPRLERVLGWLERQTAETILWIAAIAGIYLAAGAAASLGFID
jgi:hypothetical protein